MKANTHANQRLSSFRLTAMTASLGFLTTLASLSAHASCADLSGEPAQGISEPSTGLHQLPSIQDEHQYETAAEKIVGTWHVTYAADGVEYAQAFIQWHDDHTEWENINKPVLGGNICMGSWKHIDSKHVFRNHYGWIFTQGIVSNYFNETETDEVSRDGKSYEGVNVTKIYDLQGNFLLEIDGTAKAIRISP